MRRIITLVAFALAAFVVTPVLAAPGGNGNRGPNRSTPAYNAPSSYQTPGYRGQAVRPAPAPVINRAKLVQAERLKTNYNRQRMALVRSLRVEQSRLDRLTSTRFVNRAQVRQAQRRVDDLERQIARLDSRYRTQLASILTPTQVRFFLSLG